MFQQELELHSKRLPVRVKCLCVLSSMSLIRNKSGPAVGSACSLGADSAVIYASIGSATTLNLSRSKHFLDTSKEPIVTCVD